MTDSPRWCARCQKPGDHHTDRCTVEFTPTEWALLAQAMRAWANGFDDEPVRGPLQHLADRAEARGPSA